MATVVVMPQLGNTVESCLLTAWAVALGDQVTADSELCTIETDKSSMEVPAGVAGTVLALLVDEGDDIVVKSPIAIVGDDGEDVSGLVDGVEADESDRTAGPDVAGLDIVGPEGAGGDVSGPDAAVRASAHRGATGVSPRARGLARSAGVVTADLAGTGPQGRVIAQDVQRAIEHRPQTTRAARRAAGVDEVEGTGLGGRVSSEDVREVSTRSARSTGGSGQGTGLARGSGQDAGSTGKLAGAVEDEVTETPITGVRKLIAERMMASLASSAQLTLTASAPAGGLLALRARLKQSDPALGLSAVTIGDLANFAAARTVRGHPMLNATLVDDLLRSHSVVHLGVAVDTPRGLLVPTVRGASGLTLAELSAETNRLAGLARHAKISPDDLTGGTFTVTNLGSFGIESFTPVLNVPQTGILGVGAIVSRPNADGGVEQRLGLSLTIDHRVVDGADGARFLRDLSAAIASIDLLGFTA